MSTRNYVFTAFIIVCVAAGVVLSEPPEDRYDGDPVLEYYCTQAAAAMQEKDPWRQGLTFSLTTTSYYKRIGPEGQVNGVDTAVVSYWYSHGSLDSQVVIRATAERPAPPPGALPGIFSNDFSYTFYPNDAGGEELAIGLDRAVVADSLPVGLVMVDRENLFVRRLYLHYPNRSGFKRFSTCFRMVEHDGFLFPDSIWEVAAKEGILSTEHYRRETHVDSVRIAPR